MTTKSLRVLLLMAVILNTNYAKAETVTPSANQSLAAAVGGKEAAETTANSNAFPKQILRTGINLNAPNLSANSIQLANNIQISPVLERIQTLRRRIEAIPPSAERNESRLDLLESKEQALQIINRTNLEIDFVLAEMSAEQNVYNEILSSFTGDRDKLLARINATSFISNGVLWALAEGFDIPTHTRGVYANPSGINGILAGVIPSFASMYTLRAVNGKKKTSEVEPNMLAKIFNYPTTGDIEYPSSVWLYLNEVPAGDTTNKSRKDQMVDRWISDSNIPGFNNRSSKSQLDVITASCAQKKGLTIGSLTTRQVMLQQLSSEILKMKRMLLELSMVVEGNKQLVQP